MKTKELKECQCCGNTIYKSSGISAFWLLGKKFVYWVCFECYNNKSRQKIFLRMQND